MKVRILTLSLLLAILALTISRPVTAQDPEPWGHHLPGFKEPKPGSLVLPHGDSHQAPDGLQVMPPDIYPPIETRGAFPQATGGPDDFGYTWDDSVQFSWIDATSGTNSGLQGDDQYTGPIDIGFDFRFYENTYSQLYITTNGLVTFGEGAYQYSNLPIPNPALPNNFIAVFWDDLCVNHGNYNTGAVYYKSGGTAPNRYFVVEWYQVSRLGSTNLLTFEVIIYENGDIVMQYLSLSGYLQSATVGIEDDVGVTGLQYLYNAPGLSNNKAIRFYRPGPVARVKMWPLYQGRFTRPGATEAFQVFIRNTGELGADTYDLTVSSTWPATLYAADGITPLTDTDGDGTVDTGSLAQGGTFTVTVKVQTPMGVNVGDYNTANITVRSSLNTSKSKTVTLQTAIPAPFAQVYRDNPDNAMSLYLVQPAAQAVKKATANYHYGYYMSIAEMPGNNFVYLWGRGRCLDANCNVYVIEIEYTLLDRYGNTVRPVSKLTNHSAATMYTYDASPAVAVAPNGRIGVVWHRCLWNSSTSQYNYNIWFAILDSSGNLVYGPANLTNNNTWGTGSDYGVPRFYSPHIAATGDNRFVLAWQRHSQESSGGLADIYYAVRDTNGTEVKGVSKFTNGVAGSKYYYYPTLATLTGNRALLAYMGPNGISYAVLDSSGNTLKPETVVGGYGWGPDAVQLSSGNIVVAWSGWANDKNTIMFAVLDNTKYDVKAGPTMLNNPAAPTGDAYVSVAADAADRAILTWMDYEWSYRRNLYYALVNGSGSILTPPMIFRTSQAANPYIETSYEGYGNTSYSWTPPAGVDLVASFPATLFGGPSGGNAAVGIRTANHGTTLATNVILTATLASDLAYVSDTSGRIPTISGNDVVWNLPNLDFLDSFNFTLHVRVPSTAEYGARYPITLTLTAAGPEANFSDNTANAQVMAARQVFLPLILRSY